MVAIRPEPELERALQTPTREEVQQAADRATYERRAKAVERERAIAENELQTKIELARREQQLVEQHGANTRRQTELDAQAQLVAVQGQAEREHVAATAAADRATLVAAARGRGRPGPGRGQGGRRTGDAAGRGRGRGRPARRLPRPARRRCCEALALKEFAGQLPEIGTAHHHPGRAHRLCWPSSTPGRREHARAPGGDRVPPLRVRRTAGPARHPRRGGVLPARARPRPRRGRGPPRRRCTRR